MSRNIEYISPAGLRTDGRRPTEHRRVVVQLGAFPGCDGSCVYTAGGTNVVARVNGPHDLGSRNDISDDMIITCDVSVTPFAGERRRNVQRGSKHTDAVRQAVLSVAQSLVVASQYPSSRLDIVVEVLLHDGGEMAAAINATCLALADANIAMRDTAVALSLGILENTVVCDLTSVEVRSQCPTLVVAVRAHQPDALVFVDMNSRVSEAAMDSLFKVAVECGVQLYKSGIEQALKTHASECVALYLEKTAR